MSKLADLIVANETPYRKPIIEPMQTVKLHEHYEGFKPGDGCASVYEIGAQFAVRAVVKAPKGIDLAVDRARRSIIEDVFGEFRRPIHQVRIALMMHDYEAAEESLNQLESQMFGGL